MTALVVSLAATIASLAAAVWAGIARRRPLHYGLVVLTFVLLGVAIWRAEAYGATLAFTGTAGTLHGIHMVAVALTFLLVPAVVWTGWRLARASAAGQEGARTGHRKLATWFVTLIVVTAALGTAMTVLATPR